MNSVLLFSVFFLPFVVLLFVVVVVVCFVLFCLFCFVLFVLFLVSGVDSRGSATLDASLEERLEERLEDVLKNVQIKQTIVLRPTFFTSLGKGFWWLACVGHWAVVEKSSDYADDCLFSYLYFSLEPAIICFSPSATHKHSPHLSHSWKPTCSPEPSNRTQFLLLLVFDLLS